MKKIFLYKKYIPPIDWGALLVEINKQYNVIIQEPDELITQVIEIGYELLPVPIRVIIKKERFVTLIRDNSEVIWKAYLKLQEK